MRWSFVCALILLSTDSTQAEDALKPLPMTKPETVGLNAKSLTGIDRLITQAIARRQMPGAVVLVLRKGQIAYHKAFGTHRFDPKSPKVTKDTIFDLASLTKPIATGTSIMILLQQGKLRLNDRVSRFLPEFKAPEQSRITIRHLLLHTSGLIPDNSIRDYQNGPETAWKRLFQQTPKTEPGEKFKYSDVGFLLLGKIVERVSGESLDSFAEKNIFTPLGMNDTTFNPDKALAKRIAPTRKEIGKVHDPRAYLLGGVAGHAGLFSTANDLARYCHMLMSGGKLQDRRVLSPLTVQLFTKRQSVPDGIRSLGWDVDTAYSSNRGELFTAHGFGHTGFTGTSIWIDRQTKTGVIFLSNRVHPDGSGSVVRLRNQVATIVGASIESLR